MSTKLRHKQDKMGFEPGINLSIYHYYWPFKNYSVIQEMDTSDIKKYPSLAQGFNYIGNKLPFRF